MVPATSDREPVVWVRGANNGNLPDPKTLDLVLRSLLKAGINEIESPNRLWMIPPSHENSLEFFKAFGGVSPILHLPIYKDERLVKAAEKIGEPRYFGDALMISGQIDYAGASGKNGKEAFKPTIIQCMSEDAANEPYFGFESQPRKPFMNGLTAKNTQSLAAA